MIRYSFRIIDLAPFFLIGALLLLCVVVKAPPRKKACFSFLLMFIFAALRYGIGYDYYMYVYLINHQIENTGLDRIEPLSRLLIEFAHYTNPQVFFILGSFLALYPVYFATRRMSINPALSLFVFFMHPLFYLNGLSIVRNSIAFSLVFLAIYYLGRKRVPASFLLIIIASLFHKSAIIALLIFPIRYISNNRFVHAGFYLSSFVLSSTAYMLIEAFAGDSSLLASAQHYIVDKNTSGGGMMTIVVNLFAVLHLLFWDKLSSLRRGNQYLLGICNVGVCLWNVFLGLDSVIAERLSIFFIQAIILLIPTYSYVLGKKYIKLLRQVTVYFFLFLFASYFYINVAAFIKKPSERMSNVPYQTIFHHIDYSNYKY